MKAEEPTKLFKCTNEGRNGSGADRSKNGRGVRSGKDQVEKRPVGRTPMTLIEYIHSCQRNLKMHQEKMDAIKDRTSREFLATQKAFFAQRIR